MAGEAGEVCNAVKKLRRLADGTNTAKDPQTEAEAVALIAQELADTIIYADLLAARLGIDLERAIRDKFNDVSRRMSSGWRL
jgi:NTP pyrophosphatase (non-canonical NTP hydrolase)